MGRWFVLAIAAVLLSACDRSGGNKAAPPVRETMPDVSTAISPKTTSTIAPTLTPTFSPSPTPVPPSLILADFPLALGATWKYSAQITYQDPKDYARKITWSGFVTDRIIDTKKIPGGGIAFTFQEELDPPPPPDVWRQSRSEQYAVTGDGIYDGGTKIYQYPLSDHLSWKRWSDAGYSTDVSRINNVTLPYGKLSGCYSFFILTNPDVMLDVFCPGIGFVEHHYKHFGTLQNESFELISYKPGQ